MTKDVLEKFIIFLLLCNGILEIYAVGSYSLRFVLVILSFILYTFVNRKFNVIPRTLKIYFIYYYLVSLLNIKSASNVIDTFILIALSSYIVYYSIRDFNKFINIYKALSVCFIIFFFLQEFSYYILGARISGILSSLPLAISQDTDWISEHNSSYRSTSFFSEPAHFAQFLLPLLAYELFGREKSTNQIYSFVIIIVLFLLQSGNAIIGSIPIAIAYVIRVWTSKSNSQRIKLLLIIIMSFGFATYYVSSTMGQDLLIRSETLVPEYAGYLTSAYVRIYRGWDLFSLMSPLQQLFGLGNHDTLVSFIHNSGISDRFFNESDTYLNGAQSILIYTGYIGALIFTRFIYLIWKQTSFAGKTVLSILIVFMFMASNFLGASMAVCLVMSTLLIKTNNRNGTNIIRRLNNNCQL